MMKVSVIMATYNGRKFINEQIESIYSQTKKPDEVLIYDDGSTDETCEIIDAFIKQHGLENSWKIKRNISNKGVVLNFLDGAEEATGEIIFYADQDDIWDKKKIELMMQGFAEHPEMCACYCLRQFILTDGSYIPMKYDFMNNPRVKSKGFQKISVSEAVRYNKSPGLCLAIRKALIGETREMILNNHLTHDLPIGTVAAIHDGYYVLNQRLVYYRQHGNNVSSARYTVESRLTGIEKQIKGRQVRLDQMRAIREKYYDLMNHRDSKNLTAAIISTEKSIENIQSRNLLKLFVAIFNPNPMMNNWIAVNNFLICLRNKT